MTEDLFEEAQEYANAVCNALPNARHPKCKGYIDEHGGFYDCAYDTSLSCEDCKYGLGRKDPDAECNQL